MKRYISICVLVFLFCLSLGGMTGYAYTGDTWTCKNCGSEASGNFCNNCGNPRPEEPDDIVFDELEEGNIVDIIPKDDVWGTSLENFKKESAVQYETCQIGKKQGLRATGIDIDSYPMDAYFVFEKKGLSKIVYLLSDTGKHSSKELQNCYDALVDDMKSVLDVPDTQTDAVATWEMDKYSLQIGKGKFKNYSGSDNSSVGIVFKYIGEDEPEEKKEEAKPAHNVEYKVLKEYKWDTSYYHYEGIVIKNLSGSTKDFDAQVMFYDEKNNLIGVSNPSADVVGNHQEALIICSNESPFHHIEYTINVRDSNYYEVQSFINVKVQKADGKAIIIANNTGKETANFVEYKCLFINKKKEVVGYDWGYLVDNDSQLKPGMTEMREAACFEPFKTVEVYYTGRYR